MIKYYVDINKGDDSNTGLTSLAPKKTLNGLLNGFALTQDTIIYLNKGEYILDNINLFNCYSQFTLIIEGKKQDTKILQTKAINSYNQYKSTVIFRRLIYSMNTLTNALYIYNNVEFQNVVLDLKPCSYGSFLPHNSVFKFINCVCVNSGSMLRTDGGNIQVINSYGKFTSGYSTNNSSWNTENNVITSTLQLDDKYKILEEIDTNIGVYSGEYTWNDILFYIYKDNIFYNIKEEYYNTETKEYNPIELENLDFEDGFDVKNLIREIIIGDETFKPINKFSNFKLITNKNSKLQLNGIKSIKEMIISKNNLSTKKANSINKFYLDTQISGHSNILTIVSNDNGITWKYYEDDTWKVLDSTCNCNIDYNDMTEKQKEQWDKLKDEIIEKNHMTIEELESANLKKLDGKLRFLYVLKSNNVEDNCILKKMMWNINEINKYTKLGNSDILIYNDFGKIIIKPIRDTQNIIINMESIKE